jgi:hypothetical protein
VLSHVKELEATIAEHELKVRDLRQENISLKQANDKLELRASMFESEAKISEQNAIKMQHRLQMQESSERQLVESMHKQGMMNEHQNSIINAQTSELRFAQD